MNVHTIHGLRITFHSISLVGRFRLHLIFLTAVNALHLVACAIVLLFELLKSWGVMILVCRKESVTLHTTWF
jgi:hypothetical protein